VFARIKGRHGPEASSRGIVGAAKEAKRREVVVVDPRDGIDAHDAVGAEVGVALRLPESCTKDCLVARAPPAELHAAALDDDQVALGVEPRR
jgi:hypothetical protein